MNRYALSRFAAVALTAAALGCSSGSTTSTTAAASDATSDSAASDALVGDSVSGDTASSDTASSDTAAGDSTASDASGADATTDAASSDAATTDTSGSDTASGDSAGGAPVPLDQFTQKIYEAMCGAMVGCGGHAFATVQGCMAFLTSQFDDQEGPIEMVALVKAGKATYDAVAAGKCLAMYSSCNIVTSGKTPAECAGVFIGNVADGASCDQDEECKSAYCKKSNTLDSSCPGVCAAKATAGAACQEDSACAGDLLCIADVCTAPGGKVGDSCTSNSCGDGLYCASGDGPTNVCKAKLNANMPCDDEKACKAGLFCGMSASGDEQICQAQAKLGEPCGGASGSGSGGFGSDAFGAAIGPCEGAAICASPGVGQPAVCVKQAKIGEACSSNAQCGGMDVQCQGLSTGKAGTCQPLPGKEQPCKQPDFTIGQLFTCQLPLVCDAATSKCVDPPGAGQSCLLFCAKGLTCSGGKCTAKSTEGQPCGATPCADGLICDGDKCIKPVCK